MREDHADRDDPRDRRLPSGDGRSSPDGPMPIDDIVLRLTQPGPDVLRPPDPDPGTLERSMKAHVQQRLAEEITAGRRRVRRRERALGRSHSRVRRLEALLALDYGELATAQKEHGEVGRAPLPPRGPDHDSRHRALSRLGLLFVLALCVFADYLVDRSAFQALLLPLRLTQVLALFVAVVQMAAAHTVGRLLRRLKEAPDPDAHRHERLVMRGLAAFIAITVVGLALLRGLLGGMLMGLILLGVGAAAAVVAVVASYFHASSRLDALAGTQRRVRRAGRRAARTLRRLERERARREADIEDFSAAAGAVVASIEAVYARTGVHLNGDEPAWIDRYRRWTRRADLPVQVDLRGQDRHLPVAGSPR